MWGWYDVGWGLCGPPLLGAWLEIYESYSEASAATTQRKRSVPREKEPCTAETPEVLVRGKVGATSLVSSYRKAQKFLTLEVMIAVLLLLLLYQRADDSRVEDVHQDGKGGRARDEGEEPRGLH